MLRISFCLSVIIALFSMGCSSSEENTILDLHKKSIGKIDGIDNIVAIADCKGPDGEYTTYTASGMKQPYLFFEQDYSYKSPFSALVKSYNEGYGLDAAYDNAGAISTAMIGVVKAHEFHKLMLKIDQRYSGYQGVKDTLFFGLQSREISAVDPLNLPVKLYFDTQTKRLNGFTQVNPYKKSELIQVYFYDWYRHESVWLFDKVKIIQGTAGEYDFDYQTVVFNDPQFEERKI